MTVPLSQQCKLTSVTSVQCSIITVWVGGLLRRHAHVHILTLNSIIDDVMISMAVQLDLECCKLLPRCSSLSAFNGFITSKVSHASLLLII